MLLEIITKADLQHLRDEIIQEIRTLNDAKPAINDFIRSAEVRNILNCSAATLQNLRIKGLLNPSKIGGTWYYKSSEVLNLLQSGKIR